MRTMPASRIIGKRGHRANTRKLNERPTPGTKLGDLWDLLQANRGVTINRFIAREFNPRSVSSLTDFYGLDIRKINPGQWILAGEWFGRVYVDYIAERLKQDEGE